MSAQCKSFLWDYWCLHPIIHIPHAASAGMSWDRFRALPTMFNPNNNNAKAARGMPNYDKHYSKLSKLLTHSSQNFRTSTHQNNS
jgi:hypothetical protein